jgi:hypothetical protein
MASDEDIAVTGIATGVVLNENLILAWLYLQTASAVLRYRRLSDSRKAHHLSFRHVQFRFVRIKHG